MPNRNSKPRFRVGQLVHVDNQVDYVWKRFYKAKPWSDSDGEGPFPAGWWYKMRYPGDCESFHESSLSGIRPQEIVGPNPLPKWPEWLLASNWRY